MPAPRRDVVAPTPVCFFVNQVPSGLLEGRGAEGRGQPEAPGARRAQDRYFSARSGRGVPNLHTSGGRWEFFRVTMVTDGAQ